MEKDLTRLAERLEKGSLNEKAASSPKLEALREQARQLARQLEALDKSNEVMWPEMKAAYEQTSALMQEALTQARQWSPGTITP